MLSSGDGGAGRLWEHLPHFAEINYAMPVSVATMNLQAYQSLDAARAAHRPGRRADGKRAMETHRRPAARRNYANMRKNGVTINTKGAGVRAQGVERRGDGIRERLEGDRRP